MPKRLQRNLVILLTTKVILLAIIYGCCFSPRHKVRVTSNLIQSAVFGPKE